LQVRVIHNVEVDNPERANARRAKIKRQWGPEASRANAQHLRGFELKLPVHADFRHDQVARVAQDFVVVERDGCYFG